MDTPHPDFELRLILDSAPALIHTGLPDGYLDFFNQTWLTYVGRSLEDLQGWKWTASIHPDDLDAMLLAWRTALASGEPFLHEARVRRADGEYRWILHHKIALRDEHGNVVKWYGFSIDIEDRKRVEENVGQQERKLREILDLVPHHIVVVEADGTRLYSNQALLDYYALTVEDLRESVTDTRRLARRIAHPEDVETFVTAWERGLAATAPWETEGRFRRGDGQYRWFLVRSIPLHDDEGRIVRWYITGTDIDDRKKAEEALQESEAHYRALVEVSPQMVWTTPADGWTIFANQWWYEYTGLTDPATQGFEPIHPEHRRRMWKSWRQTVAAGRDWIEEAPLRRAADGQYRWHLLRGRPMRDADGHIVRWIGIAIDIHDRREAEEALRESEARYRALIEVSPQIVWMTRADGYNGYFNRWWYDYTGLTREESEGFGWARVVHPEHRERSEDLWRQAVAAGGEWTLEVPVRRAADGQYRWHLARGLPIRDTDGQIVRWIGIAIDIHDRREAEEALRESEEHYRALIEVSPQIVWTMSADGLNMHTNQWWYEYTGLTRPETEGLDPIHPEHRRQLWKSWRQAVASGGEWTAEAPFRRAADGQYRWHLLRGRPIRDAEGRIVRWMGIGIDIHDRRESEEALRRTETWLSEAQRLSHTGSWARNLATEEMVYVSDELLRIAGMVRGDGISPADVLFGRVHPEDQLRAVEETERAIRDKTDSAGERRVLLPDGTVRHIHYVLHPVFDAAGHPAELIGTVMDVTERKQAEEALRQTQAALTHVTRVSTVGEVSASIAHELNQPLGAIANNANACLGLLSGAKPDLDEVRGALSDIVGDAERASAIIERVRGLARRSAPERIPVRLVDLVRDIAALVAGESANRRVAIQIDVPDDLPLVLGDRVELHQVLLNLVVNGMDAMSGIEPSHRTLEIRGVRDELDGHPAARISVEDRGVGLRGEHAGQLFEPFYTTKAHGMGLGLAISRSIIEAHGGRLWAEANPGPGATFSFALPAAAAA